ncbi:unnamed protein product [Rangifer tarandus platyrhynchus]|uniref:Uncharacterized protein n=1 Tax=Rangifer tarandus platyrhynchus TaxID=3082113 RepID=A0AC60A533_RANTA
MTTGPADRAPGEGAAAGAQSPGEPRDGPPSSSSRKPDFCRLNKAYSGFNFFFMTQVTQVRGQTAAKSPPSPGMWPPRHTTLPGEAPACFSNLLSYVALRTSQPCWTEMPVKAESTRGSTLSPAGLKAYQRALHTYQTLTGATTATAQAWRPPALGLWASSLCERAGEVSSCFAALMPPYVEVSLFIRPVKPFSLNSSIVYSTTY